MASVSELEQELLRLVRSTAAEAPSFGLPVSRMSEPGAAVEAAAPDAVTALSAELAGLRRQLTAAEETSRRQSEEMERNTQAVLESASRSTSTAGSVARDAVSSVRGGSGALGFLGGPVAGLFSRLFRRTAPEEAPLPQFAAAEPVSADLGLSTGASGLTPVSYDGQGLPRTLQAAAPARPAQSITVQVQTMDSRSFVDNSDQIARAVREAMLNSHALNDVVGDM